MPTHEERLTAVENDLKLFKTESIQAHQELAMELTMVKGLTYDSVRRLRELRVQVDQRFDQVDQRFDAVDQEIAEMKQDIGDIKQDVRGLYGKFDYLEKLILERLPPL
jgi:archaellum component FlaC